MEKRRVLSSSEAPITVVENASTLTGRYMHIGWKKEQGGRKNYGGMYVCMYTHRTGCRCGGTIEGRPTTMCIIHRRKSADTKRPFRSGNA